MSRWLVVVALGVVTMALAACGSSGDGRGGASVEAATVPEAPAEPPAQSAPAEQDERSASNDDSAPLDTAELERIVREWSNALNTGDNEEAADLFASGAIVVQGGNAFELLTREAAVAFNQNLPCSGAIVDFSFVDDAILVTFELGDRLESVCDAQPGALASAVFVIEEGLIELWQQVPVPGRDPLDPDAPSNAVT